MKHASNSLKPVIGLALGLGALLGLAARPGFFFTTHAQAAPQAETAARPNVDYVIVPWGAAGDTPVPADYDGDGVTDIAVWRVAEGKWYIKRNQAPGYEIIDWGTGVAPYNDAPVPADYDGDRKADVAVYRRTNGTWYIWPSSMPLSPVIREFGSPFYSPVPGDYDGDGRADLAVRDSRATPGGLWAILRSSDGIGGGQLWGTGGDTSVLADYDGDGKADLAVWRGTEGNWYIKRSLTEDYEIIAWGSSAAEYNDLPVPADYDGDGKTDVAIWRRSTGTWYIRPSSSPDNYIVQPWGAASLNDVPVPGDYDGDGKADIAVWRPGDGTWYIRPSSPTGASFFQQHGQGGDLPVLGAPR